MNLRSLDGLLASGGVHTNRVRCGLPPFSWSPPPGMFPRAGLPARGLRRPLSFAVGTRHLSARLYATDGRTASSVLVLCLCHVFYSFECIYIFAH